MIKRDAELYPEGGGIDYKTADIYDQADFIHRYCTRSDYTDLPMHEYWGEIMKMKKAVIKFEIPYSPTYHLIRSKMGLHGSKMEPAPLNLREQLYYAQNPERYEQDMNWDI